MLSVLGLDVTLPTPHCKEGLLGAETELNEMGIFVEIGLTFFQESFATFLGFVERVVEHSGVAGKLLYTGLSVKFGIKSSFNHS